MFVLKTFRILQAKLFRMKRSQQHAITKQIADNNNVKRLSKMYFDIIFEQYGDHHVVSKIEP